MLESIHRQFKELLPNSKNILSNFETSFRGVIDSSTVNRILKNENLNISDLQIKLLPIAAGYHVSPISQFAVGVVILGTSGSIYFGSNIEFLHTGLHFTIHAEQCAVINAAHNMEQGIKSIAVNAPPCGVCRQFINEIDGANDIDIIVAGNAPYKFEYYLPDSFSGKDLGVKTGILKRTSLNFKLIADDMTNDELFQAALTAANESYSPYSRHVSGIAFRTSRNKIVTGSYFESAAYNPSVMAIQSAIIRSRLASEPLNDIQEVVFLQNENKFCDYRKMTTEILDSISPGALLTVGKIS